MEAFSRMSCGRWRARRARSIEPARDTLFADTMTFRTLIASALLVPLLALAGPQPAVPAKVDDQFIPAPFDAQQINGILGERMRVNLEKRLLHIDEEGLLLGFERRPGEQAWIGEHIGKYLHAAANTWLYTHDAALKTQMDRMARRLIATQMEDGYLGTYTDKQRWTSWDVWVHKYDLLGLLSYYEITGYEPALQSARNAGDLLVSTFGDKPGQRDIIASSTHVGMAATSVLEPMVLLYRWTGDVRYLEFCRYLLRAWEQPNGPKLISSLNEKGSVFRTANAKAYEMMSDLVGLVELYRTTGDEQLLKPALIAWKDIATRRLYLTGTTSSHEHFRDDLSLSGEDRDDVGEGCATVTWLQLTWQLLRITGDVQYAEELERTVYNQLLGAQDPANGNICYFTPVNGHKRATPGINCCVSSEPRGISMIPALAWGRRANGIAVLLYAPGRVTTGLAAIESKTRYPLDGAIELTVRPVAPAKFPLDLRVPAWTKSYTAIVNGETLTGTPGQFLTIDRTWYPGDVVDIQMDMSVRVISGGPTYAQSVAIQRGPQMLALEESLNPNLPSLDTAGPRSAAVTLRDASDALPVTWLGKQAYAVDGNDDRTLVLVPFADAQSYRVWMERPAATAQPSQPGPRS